jgi:hypothetical protein
LGHDIVFGAGQYSPDTRSSRRLLAHELAHTAHRSSGPDLVLHRQTGSGGPGFDFFEWFYEVITSQGPKSQDPQDVKDFVDDKEKAAQIVEYANKINQGVDQAKRIGSDVLIVSGGVATCVLSAGTVPIVLACLTVLAGTAKLTYDVQGDYKSSDKIPTTVSAAFAISVNYVAGSEVISEDVVVVASYLEGVLTLKPKDPTKLSLFENYMQGKDVAQILYDSPELVKTIKNMKPSKSSQGTKKNRETKVTSTDIPPLSHTFQ